MRRSDALGVALDALEHDEGDVAEYVAVLREEYEQAHQHFKRYRDEVGIPDPTKKNS